MPKIDKLYAWVAAEDDNASEEGIIAASLPGMPGLTPLVGADRARVESYRDVVDLLQPRLKRPIKLKVFFLGATLDTAKS